MAPLPPIRNGTGVANLFRSYFPSKDERTPRCGRDTRHRESLNLSTCQRHALCRLVHRQNVSDHSSGGQRMGLILLIILVLLLFGSFPRWGYSRNWGYGPSGGVGLILVIVLILVLLRVF